MIYLEQVTPLAQTLIDSAQLDETGNYKLELCDVDRTPALYNLVCNGDKIPLFLQGGDRLTVSSVGRVVHNYTVEGSEESELLRRFYQPFVAGMQRLDALSSSPETYRMTDEEIRRIESEYWAEYRRIKHEQIKFIVEHKSSLAGVYALYQRLPGETYLFNLDGDVIYYRMVAEAIEERYPESSYLPLLASEIARMDARISLTSQISEAGYPDLEMTDIYGKKIRLSSLAGKVAVEFVAGKGRAGGFLVGRIGKQQRHQRRIEGGLCRICRPGIRNLPDRCGCFERYLDQRRAGAAASLDFGLRFPGTKFSRTGALQRAETAC